MSSAIGRALKVGLKGKVIEDHEALVKADHDASIFEVFPSHIVVPETSEDVKTVVKNIVKLKNKGLDISLTPRSAGTCMSGGSLTASVVLDMVKTFNHLGVLNEEKKEITVQPGVYYRDMEQKTLEKNLLMPAYTASKMLCTVGGMVGNNASGELTLSCGSTKDYVKKINIVLADGEEYEFKPLTEDELQEKIKQPTFEGKIYKAVYDLIIKNKELIDRATPQVSKNSAGYLVWDLLHKFEKEGLFDLTKLINGSQGTLGVITSIDFSLVPVVKHKKLLAVTLKNFEVLPQVVNIILGFKPVCCESYDDHTFILAEKYMSKDSAHVISNKDVVLTIIAEFGSDNDQEVTRIVEEAELALVKLNLKDAIQTVIVNEEEKKKSYWNIRRASFALLRDHGDEHHRAVPFIDDFIVAPQYLPEFFPKLRTLLLRYNLTYTLAGHIGNGNFHLIPLIDMSSEQEREKILEISREVFKLVFEYKGSMSGEHNDGIIRTPFLEMMYGKEVVHLFEEIKDIFDPQCIFNPGKKVRGSLDYALKHISTSNVSEHL